MPYEPNLAHPSEDGDRDFADANWQLPEAFSALGGQLSEEAARLAETYPAHRAEVWQRAVADTESGAEKSVKIPRLGFVRAAWLRYAAATLVVVAGSAAWVWSDFGDTAIAPPTASESVVVEAMSARFAPSTEEDALTVPAGFFQTLTGPEQEALLDLIEIQDLEQASLSI